MGKKQHRKRRPKGKASNPGPSIEKFLFYLTGVSPLPCFATGHHLTYNKTHNLKKDLAVERAAEVDSQSEGEASDLFCPSMLKGTSINFIDSWIAHNLVSTWRPSLLFGFCWAIDLIWFFCGTILLL